MDLLWIALFGLLCAVIMGLLWACERWLAWPSAVAKSADRLGSSSLNGSAK